MGFETLLGNEHIKQNLTQSLNKGRISHFYLISGPEGSGKHTLARLLAAAILCTGSNAPCGSCAACRKVLSDCHPDFITMDDPEKKTVPLPLTPLMHGSSPKWGGALAILGRAGEAQTPPGVHSPLSAPQ